MVAAVQARSLIITVNGNDWSQNLVSFEIGFDSYAQGTGLILKKGTLTLCNISGDVRPIDPIDQSDFDVGNVVEVDIDGVGPHPLGGRLRILAPPEVSPINSGIPEVEGNLLVSLSVGCNLSYYRTENADDDKTGVVLGHYLSTDRVIANLLNAAGIADSGIFSISGLPGGGFNGIVNFPYSKNGGSFIELAGEFSYSGETRINAADIVTFPICPSVLFCDDNNLVKSKRIFSPKSANTGDERSHDYTDVSIELGVNDRAYQRQLDLSSAPGTVEILGIKRRIKDITAEYPFTDTIVNSDGTQTETTYYYAEAESIPTGIALFNIAPSTGTFPTPPMVGAGDYTYEIKSIISSQTISGNFGTSSLIITGKEYQASFYDVNGRLAYEITSRYARAGSLYPDGWETITNIQVLNRATSYQYTLIESEVVVTIFSFANNAVSQKETIIYSNLFLVDRSADFESDFDWAFNKATSGTLQNMAIKQRKIEIWKLVANSKWNYTINDFSALIVNNPTLSTQSASARLALYPKPVIPFTSTITARDTKPPAIVYWNGKYTIEEFQLTGKAVFGTGTNFRSYRLQSPFWFTGPSDFVAEGLVATAIEDSEDSPQPDQFAKIEGEIINGRQYQYLVECDPDLFLSIDSPLPGVTVIEPTLKRYFLADALTWFHTANETYVAFAGIFAGSSPMVGTAPATYPSQLIAAPSPSGSILAGGFILIDSVSGSVEENA